MLSFQILAIITVVSAFMVVTRRNPMHSALWLLVTFFALAGLYLLMNAEFVAAIQIIIYAGGILVLYIFVIMFVDLSKDSTLRKAFHKPGQVVFAAVFSALIMVVVVAVSLTGIEPFAIGEPAAAATDSTKAFAKDLFLQYLYPFEIASILLLVAMIGSVILARRSTTSVSAREKELQ
ncbi:MAG: NADH-quinone oxidoreductase subunit J [Candidatus Abyssobacteria bacterium SURF_5]|uniref:NADH-quinone oxidoreductase subunit J n=1 Tax=Abyssobacteria bacterium (strain SURF_5) TaxID=2093360 RepID=A0A3A4NBG5_ABYX5|nr:MAG: NADH-quinone oxidoreductase subunit J [Candidatus Abyssubacteria bacterium SURF_5]